MFTNCVATVTGTSGGIGAAVAVAFAHPGAKVALLARNEGRLLQVAEEIERSGSIAMPVRCAGADATEARGAVNKGLAVFGSVEMLVSAAGVTIPAKVETARLEDLHEMMDINHFGVVHMVQAAFPHMKAQEFGRIVNMRSVAGRAANIPRRDIARVSLHWLDSLKRDALNCSQPD